MDAIGSTWARLATWTFDDAGGTITANYSNWDSNNKIGKTIVGGTHLCTQPIPGGTKSANCNVYAPTGWLSGSHSSVPGSWSGTYTYNTTTGALVISWSNGLSETWNLTSPSSKLARIKFSSSSYAITHGRGYGSLKAFTGSASVSPGPGIPPTGGNYVPITSIPRVQYSGWLCWSNVNGSGVHTASSTGNTWRPDLIDFSSFTSPSGGSPILHYRFANDDGCTQSNCNSQGIYGGVIWHLGGNNTTRKMLVNFFCACLTPGSAYPKYDGGLHPRAAMQIINDDGNLCGFLLVEAKNESVDPVAYQFNLHDWILPGLDAQ